MTVTDSPAASTRPLVLHVIHHLYTGGMENGLVNLVNGMPSFRHAIACVEDFSEFRQRITRPDVEVFALNRTQVGVWKLRAALFRLCRRLRPAIVHSRGPSGLDALLPARLAGVSARIHGEHGRDVDDLHGDKFKPALLRRLHAPLVTHFIAVSRELESYLVSRVGVSAARISCICNGVDTERFRPEQSSSRGAIPTRFSAPGQIVIGTVGRVQPVKDQATLVRAFVRLVESSPAALSERLSLAIVGDGPLMPQLRAQVDACGFADRIWLAGNAENVPEVLRAFDLFALPSLAEGISNTVLEAMASGLPVIATAVGGNVELVQTGVNGQLFQPGDDRALAELLHAYVTDDSVRHAHAAASRRMAVDQFSLAAMVEHYRAVYESLSGRAQGAGRAQRAG